ncbi:hypothetical protein V6N00_13805 [Tersicoccus sp. MR15.9]|uniref:hypothetical protein n=1 Tax=Tersicoccus mangrovi TaxID=3121635 RepID=UPI002FE6138B
MDTEPETTGVGQRLAAAEAELAQFESHPPRSVSEYLRGRNARLQVIVDLQAESET